MSGLREDIIKALYEHEYPEGGPPDKCRCGEKLDTLTTCVIQRHQADAVLRVLALADHDDTQQVGEELYAAAPSRRNLIERLCEAQHDAYEAAAVEAGWQTQEQSRKPWAEVPEANKQTMRASMRAVLRVLALAEHGDIQQVREQISEAIARQRLADRGINIDDREDRQSWIDMCGYLADAVMAVVAPHLAARDELIERYRTLRQAYVEVSGDEEYIATRAKEFLDRAERAEADLVAANRKLDQVRALANNYDRVITRERLLAMLGAK
jgi:hypothetical protein